ncbi:hypothetical protein [Actinoplanes friuliensis]|uniref:Uncharacterized protein n=1 Tax=Actinoplanes friuliensis DSM 7358 TaxID=1246995 RepID=U5WDA2_9ACTN|nr:hypothetical protein [Actinoplanes friuliensis]AGZ46000.1 hypothetical protein AFR_38730 [Actinoplanes friuliensis DSM 7358]
MSDPVLNSSWCTAWGSYNTPRLWSMVMNEDDPEAWRQVAAWGEISGAVKDQRSLLLKAREALVTAWPPEQNMSSAAFVEELDTLLARMDQAKTDADDTATGLANILEALRQAKNNIKPLWEQYKEKSDDLTPAWWDNAEDELDKKAQQHMITAEQIVQDNVARLRVPESYVLDPIDPEWEPEDKPGGSTSNTGSGSGSASSTRGGSSTDIPVPHNPVPPLPGHDPIVPDGGAPTPDSPGGPTDGGGGGGGGTVTGPGLSGVINPPPAAPPTGPPGTGVVPPTGGGGGIVPPPPSPIVGPGVGGAGGPRGIGTGGATGPRTGGGVTGLGANGVGGAARGVRPAGTGPRALPSGAVIGESVAGAGRGTNGLPHGGVGGAAGRPATGPRGGGASGAGGVGGAAGRGGAGSVGGPAGRGGVAGARPGAARGAGRSEPVRPPRPSWLPDEPVGSARAGAGTPGLTGTARGTRRTGDGEQPPFDPDNPWQVAEGVNPVIAPAPDTARHDPGPNVIGWRG